jgi:hypothetical protein
MNFIDRLEVSYLLSDLTCKQISVLRSKPFCFLVCHVTNKLVENSLMRLKIALLDVITEVRRRIPGSGRNYEHFE